MVTDRSAVPARRTEPSWYKVAVDRESRAAAPARM